MLWGGPPRMLLDAGRSGEIALFTSVALLAELADVLGRTKFVERLARLRIEADTLVAGYASLATIVRPLPLPRIAPDPDDDVVIATALAARADRIVTGDRPFLGLASHQGVQIVGVAVALASLTSTGSMTR